MHPRRSFGRWRLLLASPRSGVENMARDTALQARAARTSETVFSIYSWSRPTLSFGRHQPALGLYSLEKIRAANVDVVRRPTGGRAILHHHEITYSVTAPIDDAPLRATYSRINRILLDGLRRLGVDAELASVSDRAESPSIRPCFETPGEGELVAQGRKLVGSAQWRDEGALLQHGSILVGDDQSSLHTFAKAEAKRSGGTITQPATLSALLGRSPDTSEVASAMFEAVRSLEDSDATDLSEDEVRADALGHVAHFQDEGWTWRR
jgi:lipoyl(octanoyl) transferase